jgi:hypothetical protein
MGAMTRIQKIAAGAVVLVAVGGAGAAVAATKLGTPAEERKAVVNDVANQLDVTPAELTAAFKAALKRQVDRAVASGRLTQAEGNALKERIDENELPLFGPGLRGGDRQFGFRHHGHGPFHRHLDAAAQYLGLTQAALREQLEDGKTLAQVARDRNKSVDGLVDALVASKRARIEQEVEDGRLTRAEADEFLEGLRERTTAMVNGRFPMHRRFHRLPERGSVPSSFLPTY